MEKKKEITKEEFLNATLDKISQVYSGREGCRCGCGGEYTATSFMKNPRSTVNDVLVGKRLKRAKGLIKKGISFETGTTYINIITGVRRVLTFYFDEI